eukprot:gene18809-22504_t
MFLYSFVNGTIDKPLLNNISEFMGWGSSQMGQIPARYKDDAEGLFLAQYRGQVESSFASVFFYTVNATSMNFTISYYANDQNPRNNLVLYTPSTNGITEEMEYAFAIEAAVQSSIISKYSDDKSDLKIRTKAPPAGLFEDGPNQQLKKLSMFFPLLVTIAMTFPFILFVYLVVEEKERKIRSYLRAFGVSDTIYLSSWFIDGLLMAFFHTCCIMAVGYGGKIDFMYRTNSAAMFITLMTYGLSLVCLGLIIASLISRTKAAMILAVVVFCITLAAAVFMSIMGDKFYSLYNKSMKFYFWLIFFVILTPLNFLKVLQDIGLIVVNYDFTNFSPPTTSSSSSSASSASASSSSLEERTDFYWSDMTINITGTTATRDITTTYNSVTYIFIASLIYLLLAWYFDKVIPDDFGGRKHPLFFLHRSFWFPSSQKYPISDKDLSSKTESIDPDILEASKGVDVNSVSEYSLIIRDLVKKYGKKQVVDNLNLNVEKGKIIALLGHNGAGKTTTINMLTGQTTITSGKVFLHGFDVATQVDHIKSLIGICPQFDVYWPDFTAREHLTIMTLVKEKRTNIKEDIDNILKRVRLANVADHPASSYSGGMRRRMSVALAIIGSPQIVILDEPTTGIDPANRRYIWKLIKEIRQDRLVLLTTHSMEEADALGDKILIMDSGKLSAVGSSLHLKSRFGTGYKLHLIATDVEQAKNVVHERLPEASLVRVNSNNLIYSIPSMEMLSSFLRYLTLEKETELIITDWQIQNSTLEDVFLSLVNH